MNKTQKTILLFISFCMVIVLGVIIYNIFMPKPAIKPDEIPVSERSLMEDDSLSVHNPQTTQYINIYLIGKNNRGEEVYKAVKRKYDSSIDGSKIKFSINSLFNGPSAEEKQLGIYTEVPAGVKLINVIEQQDKIIVNVNSNFVNDGGTESLYKRLYQLIKTVNLNTTMPVYLYIDGQMADIVGGEGIMISQPLTKSSLGN